MCTNFQIPNVGFTRIASKDHRLQALGGTVPSVSFPPAVTSAGHHFLASSWDSVSGVITCPWFIMVTIYRGLTGHPVLWGRLPLRVVGNSGSERSRHLPEVAQEASSRRETRTRVSGLAARTSPPAAPVAHPGAQCSHATSHLATLRFWLARDFLF